MKKDIRWYHVGAFSALGALVGYLLALTLGFAWWLGLLGGPLTGIVWLDFDATKRVLRKVFLQEIHSTTPKKTLDYVQKTGGQFLNSIMKITSGKVFFVVLSALYIIITTAVMFSPLAMPLVLSGLMRTNGAMEVSVDVIYPISILFWIGCFVAFIAGMTAMDKLSEPFFTYAPGRHVNLKKVLYATFFFAVVWYSLARIVIMGSLKIIGYLSTNAHLSVAFGALAGTAVALLASLPLLGMLIAIAVGFGAGSLAYVTSEFLRGLRVFPEVPEYAKT